MEYTSGSEWRRWDLHIHTPDTKKNNQFRGRGSDEQWENFYKDILSYIDSDDITRNVSVLGITDYFSIDNYRKVMSDNVLTSKFDLILPNIEMRVSPVSSQAALNIHLICNPEIVSQLESKLFCQLTFQHSSGQPFRPIKDDLIKLGKLSKSDADDNEAYKIGIDQFVVELNKLKEIFNNDKELRENVIIVISNSSNDGASGIGNPSRPNANSGLTAIREDLYYFTDMIFSSNGNDIKYFLGESDGVTKEEIIRKYGRLKPCIHGCDAHTNDKILKPDNDLYCWIKADCTFNGLKQVIYEPKECVIISRSNPNKKKDYNVIQKVIINDDRFSTKPIEFNSNLTCFIGGKSTGKSIVLNNMVRQIDRDQYQKKYKGNEFIIQNMKVFWNDGFVSDGITEKRHIVYIPQTYLNNLSDNQEEKNEIDKIIQDVVLQDDEIRRNYDEFIKQTEETKVELDKEIYDLIKSNELIKDYSQELKENGSGATITKEIKKLQKQRDIIAQSLKINDEEIAMFDELKNRQKALQANLKSLENDLIVINQTEINLKFSDVCENLTDKTFEYINALLNKKNDELSHWWVQEKTKLNDNLKKDIEETKKKLLKIDIELKEKEKTFERAETLKEIDQAISLEEKKLSKSQELEKKLQEQKFNFGNLFDRVIHKLAIFEEFHNQFAASVNEKTTGFDDSIKFIATAPFRLEKFDEKVRGLYNNKKLKSIYKLYDDGIASDVDEEMPKKLVKPLFDVDGESYLKNGYSVEETLRSVLSNWYNIVYTVELDNDKIQTMSPGKKALVLLKLLINLAESECPILIDQPEDDLDNRSIYDELVGFLRHKKYDRQIILVTHNANIVLGSDAEEIIVANQDGTNSPNENFRFEYRSGSIENNNVLYDEHGSIKNGILNQKGIQGHICEILEGGKEAFNVRKDKYTLV